MGQGIYSTLAMLVAEELDLGPDKIKASQAPVRAIFANTVMLLDGLPVKPRDHGPMTRSQQAQHGRWIKSSELSGLWRPVDRHRQGILIQRFVNMQQLPMPSRFLPMRRC
jgi:hypothetical protein